MFTGLTEEIGTVRAIQRGGNSILLTIDASLAGSSAIGDSIAVNGVCLTVTSKTKTGFTADVMPSTLAHSDLGELKASSLVNLERAAELGSRLGGHLVSGHIDGVGEVRRIVKQDIAILVTVMPPPELLKYIILRGSVALDGVSLTVADLTEEDFTVSLIPHTAKMTILGYKKAGDKINIETDMIAKYVERLLLFNEDNENKTGQATKGINKAYLMEHGFF